MVVGPGDNNRNGEALRSHPADPYIGLRIIENHHKGSGLIRPQGPQHSFIAGFPKDRSCPPTVRRIGALLRTSEYRHLLPFLHKPVSQKGSKLVEPHDDDPLSLNFRHVRGEPVEEDGGEGAGNHGHQDDVGVHPFTDHSQFKGQG